MNLESFRKTDPELGGVSNKEVEEIRQYFYDFGQIIFEQWCEDKFGSKNPLGSIHNKDKDSML